MQYVFIAIIEDGADFARKLDECAFSDETYANEWATERRDELRTKRREGGEKDEVFVDAIDFRVRRVDYLA